MPEIATYPSLKGLEAVNEEVNRGPYVEDLKQYGVPDHWTGRMATAEGGKDCEDFAIVKANMLERLLWPRSGLCLAIVCTETSGVPDHGILAVVAPFRRRTHDEELIFLDNRIPGPLTLNDLHIRGYRPFGIQTGGSLEWRDWTWEPV